jgi:outer membrane immunogenic protein
MTTRSTSDTQFLSVALAAQPATKVVRRIALSIFGAALATTPFAAQAADMAPIYKAPAPVPYYNWTGFYAGVNAGYSVARDSNQFNEFAFPFPGQELGEFYKTSPAGFVGGAQLGYNWQNGNWLVGFETDFQGTGQRDSACVNLCEFGIPGILGTVNSIVTQKLPWFGTVRGRLGATFDRTLFYVTGGLAYGRVDTSISLVDGAFTSVTSASTTRAGWTAGAGVEAALWGNWTGKIEYLYVDLGSQTLFPPNVARVSDTVSLNLRDHIVRLGLNYRFGPDAGPVAAMPVKAPRLAAPVYNWSGVYWGVNAGYGVARDPTGFANSITNVAETFQLMPAGALGGGQLGVNWQAGRWVAGLETDIQGTGMRDSACMFFCVNNLIGVLQANVEQKLPWFGTTRVRLGYAADGALFYITGGVAYGKIDTNVTQINGATFLSSASTTKTGGVFGGGVEAPLWGNWTAKLEYLYLNLGAQTQAFDNGGGFVTIVPTSVRENIFRAGLNYRFDWGGPVVAKY